MAQQRMPRNQPPKAHEPATATTLAASAAATVAASIAKFTAAVAAQRHVATPHLHTLRPPCTAATYVPIMLATGTSGAVIRSVAADF